MSPKNKKSVQNQTKPTLKAKNAKPKLPDIDAVFDEFNTAQALVSVSHERLQRIHDNEHWQELLVLGLGVEAIEKVSRQLERVDSQLQPFRGKYETVSRGKSR